MVNQHRKNASRPFWLIQCDSHCTYSQELFQWLINWISFLFDINSLNHWFIEHCKWCHRWKTVNKVFSHSETPFHPFTSESNTMHYRIHFPIEHVTFTTTSGISVSTYKISVRKCWNWLLKRLKIGVVALPSVVYWLRILKSFVIGRG